ncbi:hypothetical protein GYB57_06695 [bacterium]|nr:hypothetical protein [bacterium]
MKEKQSDKKTFDDIENHNEDKSNLKEWKAPKLQVENTNNTLGGTLSCNSPGDDSWYTS